MYNWDLEKIYNGVDSKEFKDDFELLKSLIKEANEFDYSVKGSTQVFKKAFFLNEKIEIVFMGLGEYLSLRLSVNTQDIEAIKTMGQLQKLGEEASVGEVNYQKYIKEFPNFKEEVLKDKDLKEYEYYIEKLEDSAKRSLSDETEILLSKLRKSSGSAWENLFDTLTSTVEVDYDNKVISLSEVRNLAYSADSETRKKAYEAELASYRKIEHAVAQALTSIKQEVTTMCEARKYSSPIDRTLKQSGMTKKTLDALISAIEEFYPEFRKYLKRKGEVLGHKNGLPFYDLFAPMGKVDKEFSVEEANKYLVDRFSVFNKEISSMIEKAISNNWIDYMPKNGKVGGAFCAEVYKIRESRILTNFDGSFGSVVTLAHELGHAFHNECSWDQSPFNSNFPMQLAETASTFNETYIKDDAMKKAKNNDELLNMLETSIADDCQVIVDIMSRYYFECSVFEKSKDGALTPTELKELMTQAQLKSYGDGLDKDYLHPYMWCCKGHYYSTGLSFYNFPYAFGQLFAYGLYEIYKEKGEKFFPLYKKILSTAGQMPIRECVLQAGIDVEDINFWKKSLGLVKEKIDKFMELTE